MTSSQQQTHMTHIISHEVTPDITCKKDGHAATSILCLRHRLAYVPCLCMAVSLGHPAPIITSHSSADAQARPAVRPLCSCDRLPRYSSAGESHGVLQPTDDSVPRAQALFFAATATMQLLPQAWLVLLVSTSTTRGRVSGGQPANTDSMPLLSKTHLTHAGRHHASAAHKQALC